MESNPKPCPLCGSDAELRRYGFEDSLDYTILCKKCSCNISGLGDSREDVLATWNNRMVEDKLREQLKETRSDLAEERLRVRHEIAMKKQAAAWMVPLARTLAAGSLIQHGGVKFAEIPEESKWNECPDVHKCEKDGVPMDIEVCIPCWLAWAVHEIESEKK